MHAQFNSPIALASPIHVEGPLTDVDPNAHQATIVCLLVQGGTGGAPMVWTEGRGKWTKGDAVWQGDVDAQGHVIGGTPGQLQPLGPGSARGIAMAIVVKEEPIQNNKIVAPSIDTLTWCVDVELQ